MNSELNDLFRHMKWADEQVWAQVLESEVAATDEKIRNLLYHIHIVQRAFNDAWLGINPETAFPQFTESTELKKWADETLNRILSFIDSVNEETLAGELKLPWGALVEKQLGRTPAPVTVRQTALQVTMHSTYHRGQVNARLRELGIVPSTVDYIVWLWLDRPVA